MLYLILKHLHSGLRWIALFSMLFAIVYAFICFIRSKKYGNEDKRIYIITLILLHSQFLLGLLLFFISPKVIFRMESFSNRILRFFLLEHPVLMLLALVLVTTGYSLSKKASTDLRKHRRIFVFYLSGLVLVLLAIPWPWLNLSGGWI